jgi:hypothetical protein
MLGWIHGKMAIQESTLGGGRFSTFDSTVIRNDPFRFPHTMLSVKRVKHNMQLAFIEKLFTNCEIGISPVSVWQFATQGSVRCVEGVPYAERLCQGCDLGKVEDEKHLLLVCPSTQKIKECFCLALPLTHINTLAKLMQTTNTVTLAKFVACCQYQRTICPP